IPRLTAASSNDELSATAARTLICEDFSREAVLCKAAFGTPRRMPPASAASMGKQPADAGNEDAAFIGQSGAGLVSIEEPASRPGFDLHHGLRYGRLRHMDLGSSPAEIIAPRYRL